MSATETSDENFLKFSKTFLDNSNEQLDLAKKLEDGAKGAKDTAEKAWNQSYNELAQAKLDLNKAQDEFTQGVYEWEQKEKLKAGFALAKDSIMFIIEVAKLIGEIVFAPELAAPDAAKVTDDVLSAGSTVVTLAVGALATTDESQSLSLVETTITITPPKEIPKVPPTTKDKAKILGTKIGAKAGAIGAGGKGIIDDILKLYAIGNQAETLRVGAEKISKAITDTFKASSNLDMSGIDAITGGKQVWDKFKIKVDTFFADLPAYESIGGGKGFHDAFLYLIAAASTTCVTRLAYASAQNQLTECVLRKIIAANIKKNNTELQEKLNTKLRKDQNFMQMMYGQVLDAKRSVYLLAEKYRRAYQYITLCPEVEIPFLPGLAKGTDTFLSQVNDLTNNEIKLEKLGYLQEIAGKSYTSTIAITKIDEKTTNKYLSTFQIPIDADTFAGWGRIRFDEIIPEIVDSKGIVVDGVTNFEVVTSSNYNDIRPSDGTIITAVLRPTRLTIEQGVKGKLPDYLQNKFVKPTPLTLWTLVITANRSLPENSFVKMTFNGEMSRLIKK